MRVEAVKQSITDLSITPGVIKTLRETARLFSTHYSTMIEGNELSQDQVNKVIKDSAHFAGRERDENEVLGYYAALAEVEKLAKDKDPINENIFKKIHSLVIRSGKKRVNPLNTEMTRM